MSEKRASKKRGQLAKSDVALAAPAPIDTLALTQRQCIVIAAIGLAFGIGVLYELSPLNGLASLSKWGWPWQDLGTLPMSLALLAPFLLIAGVLWSAQREYSRIPASALLATLVVANFCMQLFSVAADPRGLARIGQIVASPDATAYFTDATHIQNLHDWMSHFHQANLTGHALSHPAGPILFYYAFLKLFGADTGAFLGGCAVGLLASVGVAVIYMFAGLWTANRKMRLAASAFYALLPGLTVFFPEFDQIYPIFSMLVALTFVNALNASQKWFTNSLALGAALFTATFLAYNLLTVGVFPVYYTAYWLWREHGNGSAVLSVLRAAATALIAAVGLYVLLWTTTGYNPLAALQHSLHSMKGANQWLGRPYRISVFTDPYDFLLGAGIIAAPIVFLYLAKLRAEFRADPDRTALTLIGLATILTMDLSGLLRGETARIWLFLQPFLVVPVALELARLRWRWRLGLFTVQWWLLVCIKTKMSFIEP